MYRPVSLQKVWFKKNLKEVPCQTLYGVIYGEDVDLLPVLDIRAGVNTVIIHTYLCIILIISNNALCTIHKVTGVSAT